MSYYTDNLSADIRHKLDDDDKWINARPVCDECGHHIQDHDLYVIHDKIMCPECVEECRRWTDDFI